MKKLIITITTMLLMVLGGVFLFMDHCVHPTEMQIAMIQLRCVQSLDVDQFTAEACQKLHGIPYCEFQPDDLPIASRLLLDRINECTIKTLKEQNMCVDKYEAM